MRISKLEMRKKTGDRGDSRNDVEYFCEENIPGERGS